MEEIEGELKETRSRTNVQGWVGRRREVVRWQEVEEFDGRICEDAVHPAVIRRTSRTHFDSIY